MARDGEQFELVIARRFLKDMKRLSREDQLRVRESLPKVQASPYQGRKVKSAETGQFRWRVGDLRIRYDIEGDVVYLLRVIKREDVYRKY